MLARAQFVLATSALDEATGTPAPDRETTLPTAVSPSAGATQPFSARECCFFCGRPLAPDERFTAQVSLGGDTRNVTVCAAHAELLRTGREPVVAAVDQDGRAVPWFAAPGYDPYRHFRPSPLSVLPLALVASDFLDPALSLSYAPLARPTTWFADDMWDDGYSSSYWGRHSRWERDTGWLAPLPAAAPETRFEARSAPETSFGSLPTAAETQFAQRAPSAERESRLGSTPAEARFASGSAPTSGRAGEGGAAEAASFAGPDRS